MSSGSHMYSLEDAFLPPSYPKIKTKLANFNHKRKTCKEYLPTLFQQDGQRFSTCYWELGRWSVGTPGRCPPTVRSLVVLRIVTAGSEPNAMVQDHLELPTLHRYDFALPFDVHSTEKE